jgi:ribosomal protein S27E
LRNVDDVVSPQMLAQYRSTRSEELSPTALDADATEEKKAEHQAKLRTAAILNAALPEALPSLMKYIVHACAAAIKEAREKKAAADRDAAPNVRVGVCQGKRTVRAGGTTLHACNKTRDDAAHDGDDFAICKVCNAHFIARKCYGCSLADGAWEFQKTRFTCSVCSNRLANEKAVTR